jgi:hypothetical protein
MTDAASGTYAQELLHRLWRKAVGTPDYDKTEWMRLEALVVSSLLDTADAGPLESDKHVPIILPVTGGTAIAHVAPNAPQELREALQSVAQAALDKLPEEELPESGPRVLWCAEHDGGGTMNCASCAMTTMSRVLNRIDYLLGQPNAMGVSEYAVHGDPEAVLRRFEVCLRALAHPSDQILRDALTEIAGCNSGTGYMPELAQQALAAVNRIPNVETIPAQTEDEERARAWLEANGYARQATPDVYATALASLAQAFAALRHTVIGTHAEMLGEVYARTIEACATKLESMSGSEPAEAALEEGAQALRAMSPTPD